MKKHFLLLLLFPTLIFSQNAKEIAKKCMASTVSLVMEDNFKQPLSLGSGFIVDDGKVITNLHVIEDAKYGYVTISGESKKHKIEGYLVVDKTNDLALLSVPSLVGTSIEINGNNPEIGEKIYAIGNPKGLSGTISEGIISGIRTFDNEELIQITAPISPGSSGGPVINNNGELIGVSVGTLESGQNLNFAIPTKYVTKIIEKDNSQITKLDIKSTIKKSTNNLDKGIKEGVKVTNLEWEYIEWTTAMPFKKFNYLNGFSIQNNLEYTISNVKLLIIMYDKTGRPVDYEEYEPLSYRDEIAPFLSKYIDIGRYFGSSKRFLAKKYGEKIKIRVLDFKIKE
mgnify:CR=1 FL=1